MKDIYNDPQKIEAYRKKWNDWVNGFSAEVNLSSIGFNCGSAAIAGRGTQASAVLAP